MNTSVVSLLNAAVLAPRARLVSKSMLKSLQAERVSVRTYSQAHLRGLDAAITCNLFRLVIVLASVEINERHLKKWVAAGTHVVRLRDEPVNCKRTKFKIEKHPSLHSIRSWNNDPLEIILFIRELFLQFGIRTEQFIHHYHD